ncbi:hypothetical protein B0H63DRAFT_206063 [Podospora didyma]|uniref:Uncharacterized protein n=1 Tax=Podospora didyma TaxID=330526 RepID=A0AAE0TVU4_9PEZI|nr:hypothetical protein B0H63DRAFT_206063 [Podospora didyma]
MVSPLVTGRLLPSSYPSLLRIPTTFLRTTTRTSSSPSLLLLLHHKRAQQSFSTTTRISYNNATPPPPKHHHQNPKEKGANKNENDENATENPSYPAFNLSAISPNPRVRLALGFGLAALMLLEASAWITFWPKIRSKGKEDGNE